MDKKITISKHSEVEIARAQDHIRYYLTSLGALKELGVLRSNRQLQADYGEWLAARYLGLSLAQNPVQKDYDATDQDGHKYQIKARLIDALPGFGSSFDLKSSENESDFLVGVFFDKKTMDLLAIIMVPWEAVEDLGNQNKDDFRFRWNGKNSEDSRVKKIYWKH